MTIKDNTKPVPAPAPVQETTTQAVTIEPDGTKTPIEQLDGRPAKPAIPGRRRTTLGELGAQLPAGLAAGSTLVRRLSVRHWRTLEEKLIAKFKKPTMNIAGHVGLIISCMCTEFGGYTWTLPEKQGEINERRVLIGQMTTGDVFYTYCFLRREAMGNIIKFNVKCPHCAHEWSFPADLDSLEVVVVDSPEGLLWEYPLLNPITIRGKRVTKFRMGPSRWYSLESAASGVVNDANAKVTMLRGAIVGFNDDPAVVQMLESDMDEITKRDLEGLVSKMDDMFVGPKMALEGNCERCDRQFFQPINWVYDSFFSNSSR